MENNLSNKINKNVLILSISLLIIGIGLFVFGFGLGRSGNKQISFIQKMNKQKLVGQQPMSQKIIIPRSKKVLETVGIIEKIENKKLILAVPKGNLILTPIYDKSRIKEMSTKIKLEVLLDKNSKISKNLKEGNVVFVKSKDDMSKQRIVRATEVTFLSLSAK